MTSQLLRKVFDQQFNNPNISVDECMWTWREKEHQEIEEEINQESLGGILDRVMKSGCSPSSVDATSRTLPLNGRF